MRWIEMTFGRHWRGRLADVGEATYTLSASHFTQTKRALISCCNRALAASLSLATFHSAATQSAPVFKPDREAFFQECAVLKNYEASTDRRSAILQRSTISLDDSRRESIGQLLDAWQLYGTSDKRHLAFVLATARRESANTFLPVREARSCGQNEVCREQAIGRLLKKRAKPGKPPKRNYALPAQNGKRYYGRGYVQLTHPYNYQLAKDKLGIDFVNEPDRALEPVAASTILIRGVLEGWFGSREPLSLHINKGTADWDQARNNVSPGSPNKVVTAAYAKDFNACLRSATR